MQRELPFRMQRQQNTQWCWAATTSSISNFYNRYSKWFQCRIVSHCFKDQTCCDLQTPSICNRPYQLELSLIITNNLLRYLRNSISFNLIINQINENRIIGVRIEWQNQNGHFISIHGYDNRRTEKYLHIGDPNKGTILLPYNKLLRDYQSVGGRWTHSYLTIPQGTSMITYPLIDKGLVERANSLIPTLFHRGRPTVNFLSEFISSSFKPHEVFAISFNSLRNSGRVEINAIGIRIVDNFRSKNIFEFSSNSDNAQLEQVFTGREYIKDYLETIQYLATYFRTSVLNYELRVVIQPEINLDAFWLHHPEAQERDIFVTIAANNFMEIERFYSNEDFFSQIRSIAEQTKLFDNNLLGD